MEYSLIIMWLGFIFAAYSVVGNDVIQTLGTFLTSNEKKVKWWILWIFAAGILSITLLYGWQNGDIAYGRLDKFNPPEVYRWYHLLPPLVLLLITRSGIPVSTTFMVLTLFSLSNIPSELPAMISSVFDTDERLGGMIQKSLIGYVIAFTSGIVFFVLITRLTEKRFLENPISASQTKVWIVLQWLTTGFLWTQWLTQDLANIYIYLSAGRGLTTIEFLISFLIIIGLLAYIFYNRGGAVQDVVRTKTNTTDIRSATFIDLIYGIILYIFKENYLGLFEAKLPMSTTWVFIGLLAGREIGMQLNLYRKLNGMILKDLLKVFFGLVVSVILVFVIKLLAT
jgi:hypothetical protein